MDSPLVAVIGATATGKTALAIALARALPGEIINADSRQVYRGMDAGTAKPTPLEQADAPHWLIDIRNPDEPFSLADFVDLANEALALINGRGVTPIVAGGTAQYVWALLEGWQVPRVPPDPALRAQLETIAADKGAAALWDELRSIDPASAASIDARNVRRVIRAIEVTRATGRPFSEWRQRSLPQRPRITLGLRMERRALYDRIDQRVDSMMAAGLVDEVRHLRDAGYACSLPSMSGIGYRQICEYLDGACSLDTAVARIKTESHRLARVQHAWFRDDDPRITWFDATAPDLVDQSLAAIGSSG